MFYPGERNIVIIFKFEDDRKRFDIEIIGLVDRIFNMMLKLNSEISRF